MDDVSTQLVIEKALATTVAHIHHLDQTYILQADAPSSNHISMLAVNNDRKATKDCKLNQIDSLNMQALV
jgi:hypothetical protein